jgi:serine/threonine protein phosphatase PrpC
VAIALRYAARSHVGLVRQSNQDSAYAGPHLLVVADGMGGHAAGDVASSLAIGEMAPLDDESHGSNALEHLARAVSTAHRELLNRVGEEPQLAGMGTTITALLRSGSKLALAHIGDSRAYLLRDGGLVQITRDHTFVQTLVDEGRLTPEEAEQHPQRSVLMRVLSDVVDDVEPDLSMREAHASDRYLLCSDGLSGVVSHDTLRETLAAGDDPATTTENLVKLALRGGAPDNVTCIVADVIEATELGDDAPAVVGAASQNRQTDHPAQLSGSAAERAAALTPPPNPTPAPAPEPPVARTAGPGRLVRRVLGGLVLVAVLIAGGLTAWQWVQSQYFVGTRRDTIAIFRGLPESIGPLHLAWVDKTADDVRIADLPDFAQDKVRRGIAATSQAEADKIVSRLRQQARDCRTAAEASATASPSPSPSDGQPNNQQNSQSNGETASPTHAAAQSKTAPPGATTASPASTVGSPVIAINPQATLPGLPSPSPTSAGAGCGGLVP